MNEATAIFLEAFMLAMRGDTPIEGRDSVDKCLAATLRYIVRIYLHPQGGELADELGALIAAAMNPKDPLIAPMPPMERLQLATGLSELQRLKQEIAHAQATAGIPDPTSKPRIVTP